MRRAEARLRIGHFREAADLYRDILSRELPAQDAAIVHTALGSVSKLQGQLPVAVESYQQALSLCPDDITSRYNLAVTLQAMGENEAAETQYKSVLKRNPDHIQSWNNLGNLKQLQNQWREALDCYDLALRRQSGYHGALTNKANTFRRMGRHEEALEILYRALEQAPQSAETCLSLAIVLRDLGRLDLARDHYLHAHTLAPDSDRILLQTLVHLARLCDWDGMDRLDSRLMTLGLKNEAVPPFGALSLEDHPERQKQRSENHVRQTIGLPAPALSTRQTRPDEKLRIGYVSADYYDHATMHLLAGTLAAHDKSRFTLFAYSIGENGDAMRDQVIENFTGFHDICDLSDADAVTLARRDRLDIAVDLMGYSRNNRAALFSHRLAPVQIAWLGYPGSTGAPYIDYAIADDTVLPPDRHGTFSEAIISLPHCYMPGDRNRPISDHPQTRTEAGLPEDAFVFSCFNNSYKICPRVFSIWMRLLSRVPGSVLWLLRENPWAEHNLRAAAGANGVDDTRLVFADRMPNPQHLARHRLADLFLDTLAYNAHTTAVDALWAGLPVLTRAGDQFAARVAASLLTATGLPEMVTTSDRDYETAALALALNPDKLGEISGRLAANRLTCPLFDTVTHTRNIEEAYKQAHARHAAGQAAKSFRVSAALPRMSTKSEDPQ
ncbi:tetratricopeptide repeat protein [Ruegeria sp. 2205SS24-7]|uniref:O-linked N-acetylglucosamine transferase, SPINDLY family protein n=1 Tax=Ruegeria discodermiae TaxID=3064389 RepID=UPI002740B0AA|nr:tetratricopeptide repeat protein [Ruegeria sp. 2205SS24-7]MDP5219044.1 tetratricopeptide repeat protein [Ruegeria sp. 2205SS24-7]